METLHVYNTLTKRKEAFSPLRPPFVGMYVCGPTVYSDPHLGHTRPAITFDLVFRYLKHLGYRVRYVRNITDVGHLEDENAGTGEDRIQKKARVEQLEPMEVAQHYANRYNEYIDQMNCLPPSIEPRASGHIPEQIEVVEKLLNQGFAYESNGSVYFDVIRYSEKFNYGILSGRNLEEVVSGSRELDGQQDKKHPADFALWKRAEPSHIMRWKSPWSEGFPGWHLECTAMSTKYLGTQYDIHGGGMDLIFPHHEGEIAQSNGCIGDPHSHDLHEARYWMHNNMLTINGQKMARSLQNFITLEQLFTGTHELLAQAYSPMTLRFFMLQAHYRSVVDFSNKSLKDAEIAWQRLSEAYHLLSEIDPAKYAQGEILEDAEANLRTFEADVRGFMNDDLNTARVIARMFESLPVLREITQRKNAAFPVNPDTFHAFRTAYQTWFTEVLGVIPAEANSLSGGLTEPLMQLIIQLRAQVRKDKNFALADMIRDGLSVHHIKLKDSPEGTEWYVE